MNTRQPTAKQIAEISLSTALTSALRAAEGYLAIATDVDTRSRWQNQVELLKQALDAVDVLDGETK